MALGQLIKFNASGIEHGTQLNPNIPIDVNTGKQYALRRMRKFTKVPTKASSQTVMNAEKVAANMKANVGRVKKLTKARQEQIKQALALYGINIENANSMAGFAEEFAKLSDTHSQNQLQHQENIGITQARNEGTYVAYTGGGSFDSL